MKAIMQKLRSAPPEEISGIRVSEIRDYLTGEYVETAGGSKTKMELSGSNVLRFTLSDGTAVIVRPSGTEPKIKIYILAKGDSLETCEGIIAACAQWAESLGKGI